MLYKFIFLFLTCFLAAEEIEVKLKTASNVKPLYLTRIHTEEADWRYFDELRLVLETDINLGGFATVLPSRSEWDEMFQWNDVRKRFDAPFWRRQKIPFVITIQAFSRSLQITVFHIEKETSKRYLELPLTGKIEEDRRAIHKIADAIHKDLFGIEGIASLRLIYTIRSQDRESGKFISHVWMSDSDGANETRLTFDHDYCVNPLFFPRTVQETHPPFFFVSYKQGQSKVYRYQQGKSEPAFELKGNQVLPSLNANGSQMAFIADAAGRPDLFIQNFDKEKRAVGKARQLFSAPRATQASPTFSPDGRKIAFVSDKDGTPRIYLMDVLSSKETKRQHPKMLTKRNRENTSPTWSPDGKKLAYSAKEEGVRQIWIYDFETGEEIPLTTGPENKENPSWASDNLHLVYNTEIGEEGELFLIHLKNRLPVQITKGPGQKRFASWESRN